MSEILRLDTILQESQVLSTIQERFGFRVEAIHDFQETPDKPNTARIVVPVYYGGEETTMFIIAFAPGDGTGDYNTYPEGSIRIPEKYTFANNQGKVHPRKKEASDGNPLPIEGMLPLFRLAPNGVDYIPFDCELEELGIGSDGTTIKLIGAMISGDQEPKVLLTTGDIDGNTRFGDPHAIFAPTHNSGMQVVAFIAGHEIKGNATNNIYHQLKLEGKFPVIVE